MSIKNVVLVGATGNLGPSILEALLSSGDFTVTVFTREQSTATFPDNVKVVRTDYSDSSLVEALKGQDAVISTIGASGFGDVQTKLIDASVKAGVKRFLPSEFGSDTANPRAREIAPFWHGKKQIVDLLKSKESEGLSWTATISGPFFDWGLRIGFFDFNLKEHKAIIYNSGDLEFCAATLSTIGKAVTSILSHPDETKNKYVYFSSFNTTQNQILAALEKVSGKKWEITKSSWEEAEKVGKEALAKQDFGKAIKPLILAAEYSGNASTYADKVQNGLLGLPKEDFEEVIAKVYKDAQK